MAKSNKTSNKNKKTVPTKCNTTTVDNKEEFAEPFSFAKSIIDVMQDNALNPAKVAGVSNPSSMLKDIKRGIDTSLHSCNCNISHSLETVSSVTQLVEEVLTKASSTMNEAIQHNISINKDLLQCKDIKDFVNIQRKIFDSCLSNTTNLYLDLGRILQSFASNHTAIFSGHVDKSISCFTANKTPSND